MQTLGANDRKQLRSMPEATVNATATINGQHAVIHLTNESSTPAVMLRVNLKGNDGEQILPVIYSDNYFHLMSGESKDIEIEWNKEDARGTKPIVEITGTNVSKKTVQ